ncbi:MAG: ATP-binding protein [Muribaculaceae bacterium]|nr:ATP-binding protein [Muribaculaceae bacterium]
MLIGREDEVSRLMKAYSSKESEFLAVYGRRRIGKTYLIKETFGGKFTFQYSGIHNVSTRVQLDEFYEALLKQGLDKSVSKPKTWFDAFRLLEELIKKSKAKRKIVFIDELPWMDAKNSRFIPAFEHFWNGWATFRKDIVLIICGSATSWMINKVFRSKGGLYNRVTYKILLTQFSLHECERLVAAYRLPFSRNMIMEGYMVMGGVPYYWTKLDPRKSLPMNINDLFLQETGELRDEFNYIYESMFKSPEKYIRVVEALAGKKSGLTRDEIITKGRLETNGRLTHILEDLEQCGFIRKYCHTDKKVKDALYQLVDCYSLFYYQIVRHARNVDEQYWTKLMQTPAYHAWCGLSFERVCLLHTRQLKKALGISGILTNIFSWHVKANDYHPGVQIDLLIDRTDGIINICEMKYAAAGFKVTSAFMKDIKTKMSVLRQYIPESKGLQAVLVTSNGVIRNKYSDEIPVQIAAEELFLP